MEERFSGIKRVLWITLVLNWFVAGAKVFFGLSTNCMVIVTDGVHSLSDGVNNVIGLIGMSMASKAPDKDHPYGHAKFETVSTLIIASLLLVCAITIFRNNLASITGPFIAPEVNIYSFLVMFFTLGVNTFVAWWEKRRGKELSSDFLIADSAHTFSDVLVTLTVVAALIGIKIGFPRLDAIVALAISGLIAYIAVSIMIASADTLTDKKVIDKDAVLAVIKRFDEVKGCHLIRSRGPINNIHVDLHILVNPKMTVEQSHQLANKIEKDVKSAIPGVLDVLIHIEPLHHDHKELQ